MPVIDPATGEPAPIGEGVVLGTVEVEHLEIDKLTVTDTDLSGARG